MDIFKQNSADQMEDDSLEVPVVYPPPAVTSGQQSRCVLKPFTPNIVLSYQDNRTAGGQLVQRQFLQIARFSFHLIFTAGVHLPRDGVHTSTDHAYKAKRQVHVAPVRPHYPSAKASQRGKHGSLVQAIAHGDPAGSLIAQFRRLYDYRLHLRLQRFLQFVFKIF